MKRKVTVGIAFICFIFICSFCMNRSVSAKEKSHEKEYSKWDIRIEGKEYFYKEDRIRIFQDVREDGSFENSTVDTEGKVDVRVIRDKNGKIVQLELISESEANELLEDMDLKDETKKEVKKEADKSKKTVSKEADKSKKDDKSKKSEKTKEADKSNKDNKSKSSEQDMITRFELSDVPTEIQDEVKKCTEQSFYLIHGKDFDYLYCSYLKKDYAYELKDSKLKITTFKKEKDVYLLLELPKDANYTISLNSKEVKCKVVNESAN